jgi:DNA (cytosine-5)-methyltransferase 1
LPSKIDDEQMFSFLDFFAGSGLVTEGFKGRFHCVWANDNCPKKREVYVTNHGGDHFDSRSIELIEPEDLPQVELAWSSFPCQDLSLAGNMNGIHGRRSGLVWEWLRLIKGYNELNPKLPVLVVENVQGLVSSESGKQYRLLHRKLSELGYKSGAFILDAANWTPQSRKRVFIVSVPKEIPVEKLSFGAPNWAHPISIINVAEGVEDWIWWKLPNKPTRKLDFQDIIDPGAGFDDPAKSKHNISLIPENHTKKLVTELASGFKAAPGYKRRRNGKQVLELRFDGLAGCLRTPAGGSSRQHVIQKTDNGKLASRLLTISEAAELMGVPKSYRLPSKYNVAYHALGDAVAVPAVQFLSEHLLSKLVSSSVKNHAKEEAESAA